MEISSKNDLINEILKCGNYDEILNAVKAAKEKSEKETRQAEIAQAKTNAAEALVNYTKLVMEDNPIFSKLLEDKTFITELNKFALNALEDMKNYLSYAKAATFKQVKNKPFSINDLVNRQSFSTDDLLSTDDLDDWDKAIQNFMNKNKY